MLIRHIIHNVECLAAFVILTSVTEASVVSYGAVTGRAFVVSHTLASVAAGVVGHAHVHFYFAVLPCKQKCKEYNIFIKILPAKECKK